MESLNIAEGKARFSELISRAEKGEEVQITRRGKPVVRLVPVEAPRKKIDLSAIRALAATLPESDLTVAEMRRLDLL